MLSNRPEWDLTPALDGEEYRPWSSVIETNAGVFLEREGVGHLLFHGCYEKPLLCRQKISNRQEPSLGYNASRVYKEKN